MSTIAKIVKMSKEKEEWRPVVGYEELYEVSDWGRVKSLARIRKHWRGGWSKFSERIMKPNIVSTGYCIIHLWKNKKHNCKLIHRLVYETFIGEIPAGMEVNHIDENKSNNAVWNLNLLTRSENMCWGTMKKRLSIARRQRKFTPEQIAKAAISRSKPVRALNPKTLEIVYNFSSATEAEKNGFNASCITGVCKKRHKTHKGLIWEYV